MKGIVLAGGSGTRLHPITKGVSKHLLPIYDKPMVYYPISILMLAGIRDILIISTPEDYDAYIRLLGDGSNFGINLFYEIQPNPEGLAQAFIIGENFLGEEDACLVLGDNIFYGHGLTPKLRKAKENAKLNKKASVFGYKVKDPHRYGVVDFDENNQAVSIEEKPEIPKSNYAVTGLYFYPNSVIEVAKTIRPSERNELEITSINNEFLKLDKLDVNLMGRGFAWLDTGTHDSLLEASNFIKTIESRQGLKISCIEEIAYKYGYIDKKLLKQHGISYNNEYGDYLLSLMK